MARLRGEAKEEDSTFGRAALPFVGPANDAPLYNPAAHRFAMAPLVANLVDEPFRFSRDRDTLRREEPADAARSPGTAPRYASPMSEARDARRWAAYERLAGDSAAAPNERAQALARIAALRARYPGGRPKVADAAEPAGKAPGPRWRWANASSAQEESREPPPRPDPEAARVRREQAVARQRADVERVPRWQSSETLRALHDSGTEWSTEEQGWFKEQRVRLTGSSRAVDL
ncbi:hypothetical protein LBMAG42_50270 [Deltaproteobacteria bacterium]|nr:hypothetical protein LBMAG42_50270 [Deltaproteobacteria bacterium]